MARYVEIHRGRKRKETSFFKFSMAIILSFSVVFVSMLLASTGDDAGYYLLTNGTRNAFSGFMGKFTERNIAAGEVSGSGGSKTVTRKGELNLSLIDRIPDVSFGKAGYIKELLSIYRDAQKGKIITDKRIKPALQAILAQHINEVGTMDVGGYSLPSYYFDPDAWEKDKPGKCIYGYTSVYGSGNGRVSESGGYGVLQHLNTPAGSKSKVNPVAGVVRGVSPGDCRFLPDMIQTSLSNFGDFLNYVNSDYLSEEEITLMASLCNNRGGAGACAYSMGLVNYTDFSKVPKTKKYTKNDVQNTITIVVKLFDDYLNNQPDDLKTKDVMWIASNSDVQRMCSVIIAQHSKNWYIDLLCYNYLVQGNIWGSVLRAWDILYPAEKSLSASNKKNKLQSMVKGTIHASIADATGNNVSAADCGLAYGGDNYSVGYRASSYIHGSLWHVNTTRCKSGLYQKYSNGDAPYYVSSFDFVAAGYLFVSSGFVGRFYYAYLLKAAGVNSVDPTNPSTYVYQTTVVTRQSKAASFAGQLNSVYDGCKIKQEDLTPDRIAVLNAAAEIAYGGHFVYSFGGFKWQEKYKRFGTDCAHFCCLAYYYSGMGETHYYYTGDLYNGNDEWEYIKDFSKAKPGDVIVTRNARGGHAEIYLSGSNATKLVTIGAHCSPKNASEVDNSVDIDLLHNMTNYGPAHLLRYKNIDKGLRGDSKKVPTKKGDFYPPI